MRFWLVATAAALAFETAALACSCIATDDPVELRRFAADAAQNATALVEVEVVSGYDAATGAGERMRVVRTLAGQAPAVFRIQRLRPPSSASCDVEYRAGERALVILYPAEAGPPAQVPVQVTSGLCTVHLLDKPVYRDALVRAIGAPRVVNGERG